MPIVRGPSYVSSGRSGNTCSATSGGVIRRGPSYISSPWGSSSLFSPSYHSSPVIAYHSEPMSTAGSLLTAAVVLVFIATMASINISRDCHLIRTECSLPDWFGRQVCNDVFDCKW